MKEFFVHFFGQGTDVEFSLFTLAHFAPIVWMLFMIWLIYKKRDAIAQSKYEEKLRYVLAFALIICDMSYYWRLVGMPSLHPSAVENLPIGICAWSVIFCSFLMIGKSQTLFDIIYFWLFSGTLFALITPTPITYTGPTRYRYYQFWLEHTLGYISIFYMIFVHKMRPNIRSIFKSLAGMTLMALLAYWVNTRIPGANYLYMARPEAAPSVLDILPANFALRTSIMAFVMLIMYALAYLPWYRIDKKAKQTETV